MTEVAMYLVENRVFYTCGRIVEFPVSLLEKNIEKLGNIDFSAGSYWFNRFSNGETEYLKFIIKKDLNSSWYNFNIDIDFSTKYTIENFTVKVHKNGITSTEVVFRSADNSLERFDEELDSFSNNNTEKLFEAVYRINEFLEELGIVIFPGIYKYGVLIADSGSVFRNVLGRLSLSRSKRRGSDISNKYDSYLLRIHRIVTDIESYSLIQKKYAAEGIKSVESDVELKSNKYKGTLFWAFVLWCYNGDTGILTEDFSDLLDIDTYTMNEIVVYNTAGNTYTEMMYEIDFNTLTGIRSTDMFEMYKVNGYFLQRNKLEELSFSESVNNFVSSQREIEKFKMQQETFLEAEKKFHEVYNAVEANEKTTANRIIQFVLTSLTLLTIISVSKDMLEFIKAEFLNEQYSLKINFFTRTEVLSGIFLMILVLFFVLRKMIKKI